MKNRIALFLALMVLCSCLFGCGSAPTAEIPPTIAEAQPDPTAPTAAAPWSVSQNHEMSSVDGAYVLDEISVSKGEYLSSVSVRDERVLVSITDYSSGGQDTLTLYDLSQKQPIWTLNADAGLTSAGLLGDGTVCAYWAADERLVVFGADGAPICCYEDIRMDGTAYLDDSDGIWLIEGNDLICLSQGSQTRYPLPFSGTGASVVSVQGSRVLYGCWQGAPCGAYLDLDTGEGAWLPRLEQFSAGDGLFFRGEEDTFYYSLDGEHIYSIPLPNADWIYDAMASHGHISFRGSDSRWFLDTDSGILGRLDVSEYYLGSFAGKSEILPLRHFIPAGEQVCLLMEYPTIGTQVEITELVPTDRQLANKAKAESFFDRYGVYVNWMPTPENTYFSGYYYAANSQTDEAVTAFLEVLEGCLALLPPNIFRSITQNQVCCVRICSMNGILSDGEGTVSAPGGFVNQAGNAIQIVVNAEPEHLDQLEQTLVHEMMHVLERALELDYPQADVFSLWSTLNPEGFAYAEDYSGDWGDWDSVFSYYEDTTHTAYFPLKYGQVNPLEDRATMLECMAFPYSAMFRCTHIRAKADFLAQLLREYYPELYENSSPIWMNYQK